METKKSIVKSITPNGTWEGSYGLMYKFEIEFENGDVGEYLSKSENQEKFVVGQDTDYQFKGGQYPRVKPISNFQPKASYSNNNDDTRNEIRFSVAFKAAVELCAADKIGLEEIMETTIGFNKFLSNKRDTNLPF